MGRGEGCRRGARPVTRSRMVCGVCGGGHSGGSPKGLQAVEGWAYGNDRWPPMGSWPRRVGCDWCGWWGWGRVPPSILGAADVRSWAGAAEGCPGADVEPSHLVSRPAVTLRPHHSRVGPWAALQARGIAPVSRDYLRDTYLHGTYLHVRLTVRKSWVVRAWFEASLSIPRDWWAHRATLTLHMGFSPLSTCVYVPGSPAPPHTHALPGRGQPERGHAKAHRGTRKQP